MVKYIKGNINNQKKIRKSTRAMSNRNNQDIILATYDKKIQFILKSTFCCFYIKLQHIFKVKYFDYHNRAIYDLRKELLNHIENILYEQKYNGYQIKRIK